MEVVPMAHAAGHSVGGMDLERNSQDNDMTSSSDAKSLPASQASSFGESPTSQIGGHHDTKETSQTSAPYGHDAQIQQPSMVPAADLPDLQYVPVNGTTQSAMPAVPRINTAFSEGETLKTRSNSVPHEMKQGQKRTANGHIKTPSSSTVTSPESATIRGHTRQTSQVGELSAQLRARLSYAMVKVQHGWETRTIDEVETLASQQPSPMSLAPSPNRAYSSPRSAVSLPNGDNAHAQYSQRITMAAPPSNGPTHHDHAYPPSTQPSYANHPSATSNIPSLAPPVDLHSRPHPRRISKPLSPHPSLLGGSRGQTGSNLSAPASAAGSNPHTPPQLGHQQQQHNSNHTSSSLRQAPSQRASATAMEKDAIETLLFMSSPGNSQGAPGHYGAYGSQGNSRQAGRPGSAQQQPGPGTPLRGGFIMNLNDGGAKESVEEERVQPRKKEVWERANLKDEESIDRVLDQMGEGDDSSDDEEESTARSGGRVNGVGRGLVFA